MIDFRPQRIKALREGLGLTTEEMAVKMNKSKQQINVWEKGVNKPSIDNLLEICNTFDTGVEFFFTDVSTTVEEGDGHATT